MLTFDLGEIVVSKDTETILGSPSIIKVSSKDIEIKNAQTVDEALDFIPGVRLSVGSRNEPYIMVRGFSQDKVLVLLDGVPIASPYYGYVDLSQIPVESIAKIKVIKNLVSVVYGANTLGGVINIVSKKPTEQPYFSLSNGFSEQATHHHILTYAVKSDNASLWFSGSRRQSEGFRLSREFQEKQNENGGLRENSYYEKNSFSLKLGWEEFKNHNPSLIFNYIDNQKGVPPHTSSSKPRYRRFTEWKRWMLALADELKISDDLSIKGRIFYDKYDNTLKQYDDATYTTQSNASSWTSVYDEYAIGGSLYLNFIPSDIHSLNGALNFKRDVHKEQDDINQPWETYKIHTYSFGLQDDIKVNERLSLSIGMSFDLFDQVKTSLGEKGSNVESFNPALIINYSFTPETLIYSSASKRTRFPTLNQLFSASSGNSNLKEQENINYELGIKHLFTESLAFELNYFYNYVRDLIDRASRDDPYLNISKAVFAGMEANFQTKLGRGISARLSHTYLEAWDKDPEILGRSEDELSYVPKHKSDFELIYQPKPDLQFSLLGSYHGKRYYYDSSNIQNRLGGYFVCNAKVAQKLFNNWEASIYIENIFDRNYQEEEGYPQPGRSFLFNIKGVF
jgi:outer membrane cobalamin receptor